MFLLPDGTGGKELANAEDVGTVHRFTNSQTLSMHATFIEHYPHAKYLPCVMILARWGQLLIHFLDRNLSLSEMW